HRLGEAASLMRDRNLLGVKVQAIPRGGQGLVLDLCVHLQLLWESGNLTRSSVPLIESLKNKAHLIIDAQNGKNLTHLLSILLFKDSSHVSGGRLDSDGLWPPG